MSESTLDGIAAQLGGHINLDDVRFSAVSASLARVEAAIADHARTSADTLDKMNMRTHTRMDGIVASIVKLSEASASIKDELHTSIADVAKVNADAKEALNDKISAIKNWAMGGVIAIGIPIVGWALLEVYAGLK